MICDASLILVLTVPVFVAASCHGHRYKLTAGENNALAVMCTSCICAECDDDLFTFKRDAHSQ